MTKVALVTGGSRGIGRAMVEEFCAAGYAVAFTYSSNREAAGALVECMRSQGRAAAAYQADVRDFARAKEVVAEAQKELGEIVVLVNNAGIKRDGAFAAMTPEAWAEVIDTNLNGVFNYTRVLIKDLMLRSGAVINVTSVSGQQGMAGQTNYSASKAGIIGFTRSLAKEAARFGVRVNAIAPGFIDTDMTSAIDENVRKKLYAQIPMGKPGSARDVARLAVYLAGDAAGYVTGQVWAMDGGLS
jgi:3-oxoacyl-[acyl-carrier protein] reductase